MSYFSVCKQKNMFQLAFSHRQHLYEKAETPVLENNLKLNN
jgi:hypothetical protein